ncbi:hypothetical protein GGR33_004820 [Methylobacterium brachythecii]|nr:hypothetical protein [Methylobacterium brachythecii]
MIGRLALAVLVLATMLAAISTASLAQEDARAVLRQALTEIKAELPLRQSDFKGLSTLRDRTEAVMAESRELRAESAAALERAVISSRTACSPTPPAAS